MYTKYQVISIYEGEFYHQGFFDTIREANERKDGVSYDYYMSDAENYSVLINEIKYNYNYNPQI